MPSVRATYSRPSKPIDVPSPISPPTTLLPLSRPPPQTPPRLPARPPLPPPPPGWIRTSHVVPAAYPRKWQASSGTLNRESRPFQTRPPKKKETSEERRARALEESGVSLRIRYAAAEEEGRPAGLWMAGERWRRVGGEEEGLTLVFTHANGFTKESWYPVLRRLLVLGPFSPSSTFGDSESASNGRNGSITDVWLLDDIHHAASVDLNAGLLGPVHNWEDGGRDVLNLIEHVIPILQGGAGEALGWEEAGNGKGQGKKVVGVGHSFGGTALIQAATARPNLFHALFLVDPMCPPLSVPLSHSDDIEKSFPMVFNTHKRRDRWPSSEAASSVRSSPFFEPWQEESFAIWLSHHLVPHPEGGVQLSTPKWCEAIVFGEPTGLHEGWDKLPELQVPVGFLMAGKIGGPLTEKIAASLVWRPKDARNERVMDASHQIVQEKPHELADALWRFLGTLGQVNDGETVLKARL